MKIIPQLKPPFGGHLMFPCFWENEIALNEHSPVRAYIFDHRSWWDSFQNPLFTWCFAMLFWSPFEKAKWKLVVRGHFVKQVLHQQLDEPIQWGWILKFCNFFWFPSGLFWFHFFIKDHSASLLMLVFPLKSLDPISSLLFPNLPRARWSIHKFVKAVNCRITSQF